MYIQSFHMDGFGIFSDVSVENLSPGLSIFLGENEAGKSTCLEFLRTMLIGYPDPRNKEYKRIPAPLRGGQPGGSMELRSDERGILRLTRRPGSNGGVLTLTDPDGKPLEPDMLRQMLSGVSRDVYRNVFGFSLTELEDLNSLTDEGVRNALYGASFGPGLRSPGEALKLLDKQADEIFKSGGSPPSTPPCASLPNCGNARSNWNRNAPGTTAWQWTLPKSAMIWQTCATVNSSLRKNAASLNAALACGCSGTNGAWRARALSALTP